MGHELLFIHTPKNLQSESKKSFYVTTTLIEALKHIKMMSNICKQKINKAFIQSYISYLIIFNQVLYLIINFKHLERT